ncbi:MAG: Nif3-like dinuclear metal center hexameric protein [Ruminococcaceae bacterium]|nr:Nif3-like dinuclear metal center hexameric protein [Oscillospiraceae bacterium]
MITSSDIREYINNVFPENFAFDRDNVGLILGRCDKEVKRVLITLDVDEKVAQEAMEKGADLIISHHPLMFYPIKRLTGNSPEERTLRQLISGDISLISAHTNLDCSSGGLNDYLCEKLDIINTRVIEVVASDEKGEHGFGRIGEFKEEFSLLKILERCKNVLGANGLRYTGREDKMIKRVAVNCGGGADLLDECISLGADLFITGDVKYNPFRNGYESGMAVIDAGHYETEHIVCELLEKVLKDKYPDIEFCISKENIAPIKYF